MAEGLLQALRGDHYEAFTAGTEADVLAAFRFSQLGDPSDRSLGKRSARTYLKFKEGRTMIEVSKKAGEMIKDFMQTQPGPGTVRILLQTC